MSAARNPWILLAAALCSCLALILPAISRAQGLEDDGGAEWRVEQPAPPPPPAGVEPSSTPIGLGHIGDIAFAAPNRGALITAGNGSTISPGVWFYDGVRWRELASVCGATNGRIVWAGSEEFWTISDGRAGQALGSPTERPPLEDDTLCHFAPGPSGRLEVVGSYASPAFLASSYRAMHAAACITPSDCWFAGDPLPSPQVGAFQLHWNGHALEAEPYLPEGHAVFDMSAFEGRLYESMRLLTTDRVTNSVPRPPALRLIDPEGLAPQFEPIPAEEKPLYAPEEFSFALDFLHLSAGDGALWAAAGPQLGKQEGKVAAGVTVLRREGPAWSQVIGPATNPSGGEAFPEQIVNAIAAEPGSSSAWLALDSKEDASNPGPLAPAEVARVATNGTLSDELTLPSGEDPTSEHPYGEKGAAEHLVCPAEHDCWMTTEQGWLVHLATATEREQPDPVSDPVFAGEEPITFRPRDEGVPQEPSDTVPLDTSGLEEPTPSVPQLQTGPELFAKVTVPLLSHVRSRLVHRTTLELSFHLAVQARVRLLAKRRGKVVASTAMRTLKAGNRSLRVRLDPRRWPTKLALQTHALAPLPTTSTREQGTNSVSTSLVFPATRALTSPGLLP